ncbi:MAG TPA: isoprenyl transferase [bacterium]|nr:isoprenyl transferase [bacterium]
MKTKKIPNHISITIDGNRRWAKNKGLSTLIGHTKGIMNVKKICLYAQKLGIKIVTIYAFSTENWKRSEKEVKNLMMLFEKFLDKNTKKLHKKEIQIRHIGDLQKLPISLQKKIKSAINTTKHNGKMIIQIALNYGGRDDIKRAIQKIIKQKIKETEITENLISKNLDTGELPDPDLMIRTSGEKRLSGFLLWQSSYAELYFPKVHWPDFDEKELDKAILEYNKRQRRLGK